MGNKTQKGIMPILFVGVLMGALDISIVGPSIPSIEKALQITSQYSSWIFSIYVLFNLVGISLFARLSDIYGRRNIYVISLLIFAFGSLIVSLSNSYSYLIIGRAIQGFGSSGIFPVASAVIGDLYPKEKRGQMLGLLGAVFGIAFIIGPFIAGILLNYFSWNSLFIINLPISAVLVYFSAKRLPSNSISDKLKIDWKGIIFLGLLLAGFAFSINNLQPQKSVGFDQKWLLLVMLITVVSGILLVISERRNPTPIIKFGYFRNPTIVITGIIAMVTGLIQACFVFIPKYSVQTFSVSTSRASFMLIPFVLATAIGSPVFGKLIDKYGVKPMLILGILLNLIGFVIITLGNDQLTLFYTSGVFIGLGLSILAGSSLRYIMLNTTKPEDRAITQGMLTIFTSSGQLIGAALFGFILGSLAANHSFKYVFIIAGGSLLISFFLALRLRFQEEK